MSNSLHAHWHHLMNLQLKSGGDFFLMQSNFMNRFNSYRQKVIPWGIPKHLDLDWEHEKWHDRKTQGRRATSTCEHPASDPQCSSPFHYRSCFFSHHLWYPHLSSRQVVEHGPSLEQWCLHFLVWRQSALRVQTCSVSGADSWIINTNANRTNSQIHAKYY